MSYYRPGGSGQGSITTEPVQVAEGGTGATTAADARTNLGLGSIATQAASNVAITGGTVTGITDIAVSDGGTGASTAAAARTNLLPSYTGNANKVLSLNGTATDVEWTTNGAGTVTSVDMTVPTGLSVSGNPVTSSGTLAVSLSSGYSIPTTAKQTEWDTAYTDRLKWDGGSTGLNASTGRTSLGLGTAATTDATDYAPAAKGVTNGDSHDHSGGDGAQISYNNLSNLPTLGTIASQAANNVSITGGSVTGITDLAVADGGTGASTASGARTNLLPSYTGNGGKVLAVNTGATDVEWISAGGAGTVTSVGMTVPTGLTVSGSPITGSGTLAVTYTAGYSIPTDTKQSNWDTAYGWGNHASAGYLTSSAIGSTVQGYDADTTKNDVSNTFTTNQIISANSSSDALRITQTGAGNALVVEDSTNPDSTPFVVDASGNVIIGTSSPASTSYSVYVESTSGVLTSAGSNTAATSPTIGTSRRRTGLASVVSGDSLGKFSGFGWDATSFVEAARIESAVDGTPGTNDMPGRLVFSTTADGASSPTERMRIDSAGNVGIGTTSNSAVTLRVGKNITGATSAYGITNIGTIQSDVTAAAQIYRSLPNTQAASFTLPNMTHYFAGQGTIGAGSTVTNQFGFSADNSLTGATNNYGFYSNIPSGTGRWNFYANGTAASYFGGDVQFKKAIIEEVYTITDGAAFEIDPSNGTMQLITLGASRTPKATNFANGESITLMVNDGTAYTLTWTDSTFGGSGVVWKTDGGVAPTLNTTGYTAIVLWKAGGQVYGARVGDA